MCTVVNFINAVTPMEASMAQGSTMHIQAVTIGIDQVVRCPARGEPVKRLPLGNHIFFLRCEACWKVIKVYGGQMKLI